MAKTVVILDATVEPQPPEASTKRYIKTFPVPDKLDGKSPFFITNDGTLYLHKDRLVQAGAPEGKVARVRILIEVERK